MERLRDYLTSLHVATDSEELFVLVLRGVDDAIQKVNTVLILAIITFHILCDRQAIIYGTVYGSLLVGAVWQKLSIGQMSTIANLSLLAASTFVLDRLLILISSA